MAIISGADNTIILDSELVATRQQTQSGDAMECNLQAHRSKPGTLRPALPGPAYSDLAQAARVSGGKPSCTQTLI